jgi:hypothetical protein
MDKETQKDTMQRMQKKDNAPCNKQPIRTKRKEDKKKVTFHQENCLPKSAPKRTRIKACSKSKRQPGPSGTVPTSKMDLTSYLRTQTKMRWVR